MAVENHLELKLPWHRKILKVRYILKTGRFGQFLMCISLLSVRFTLTHLINKQHGSYGWLLEFFSFYSVILTLD